MGRILIAGSRTFDAGTLEASTAVAANYPLSNLLDLQPGRKARFSTPAAVHIEGDLGSAQPLTFAVVIGHNLSAAATVRLRLADTQGDLTADPDFDSGAVDAYPASGKPPGEVQHSLLSFAEQSYRWWRIDIADSGNPDGYVQIGRVILAEAFAPSVNIDFGGGIGIIDPSPIDEGVAGHLHPLQRPTHRVQTLPFRLQTKADLFHVRRGIYQLQLTHGASRDVFVVQNPEETTFLHCEMLHGLMRGTTSPFINDFFQRYSFSLRIEELVA